MKYENRIALIDELKSKLDQYRPLKEDILKDLKEYFRIGLTYTSNALEGNSLTETETKVVLEDGLTIGGKPLKDHQEALGHSEAYSFLNEMASHKAITEENILELHRLFYYRLEKQKAGVYRQENVIISGSTFIPPRYGQVPELMRSFVSGIENLRKTRHPVEFAAILHREFVTIHPFVDGNGRTARLLMNLALMQEGYVITIIPPVMRSDYIEALKQSQTGEKDDAAFINLISTCVYESMNDYLRMIKSVE